MWVINSPRDNAPTCEYRLPGILAGSREQSGMSGFTLLEVLLSIIMLGVVVSMITMAMSGSVRAVDVTQRQAELYRQAQVVFERVSGDLRSSVLLSDVEFVGNQDDIDGSAADSISFSSRNHLVLDPEGQQKGMGLISLYVEADENNPGHLILYRSDTLLLPLDPGAEQESEPGFVLADGLRSVRFRYVSQDGEESEVWDTENVQDQATRALPVLVRVNISFWLDQEAESFLEFRSAVYLPAGAGP